MYAIKIIDFRGGVYLAGPPFANRDAAQSAFNQQVISGRFVRAELWSGTVNNGAWTDGALISSKP